VYPVGGGAAGVRDSRTGRRGGMDQEQGGAVGTALRGYQGPSLGFWVEGRGSRVELGISLH
jgi:hypothetical protein